MQLRMPGIKRPLIGGLVALGLLSAMVEAEPVNDFETVTIAIY